MTLPTQLLLAAALSAGLAQAADCERLYIGTHSPSLYSASFNSKDGSFGPATAVAAIERPTWLVKDAVRPVLYAVSETGNDGAAQGKVYSLRIAPGSGALSEIGSVASGGGGPTHLALEQGSGVSTVLVANYGTGQVAALGISGDGVLAGPAAVVQGQGSGPSPRQRGPHAHGVTIDPSGRYALVADLGADRVFIYRYDAARRQLTPAATPFLQLPPGTGPRHLVFSPDGRNAYLVAELTGDLHVLAWDAASATLQAVQAVSTLTAGYAGKISAGEVVISHDGKYVYVSNRGDNTIVAYAVAQPGGRLTEWQRIPSGGAVPWHLVLSPDAQWLLASNEASNSVAPFRVASDGRLTAAAQALEVAKPVNVLFAGACAAAAPRETGIQLGEIAGTLALPEASGPVPVALLVADGGLADRDGNAPGMSSNSLRRLAHALAAQGIASVRYDKRADLADVAQHAADAAAWIAWLKKDGRFSKVVVIGHGEGTLAGLLAANQVGANGFVALAGGGDRAAAEFGKLKMHARIIRGDADPQAGPDETAKLERARPGTPAAVIAGMNHALSIAAPGMQTDLPVAPELVAALAGFINKR